MPKLALAQVLRAVRIALGLSQREAAEAAEAAGFPQTINHDVWSKIERGMREPPFEAARFLVEALGVYIQFVDENGNDLTEAILSFKEE